MIKVIKLDIRIKKHITTQDFQVTFNKIRTERPVTSCGIILQCHDLQQLLVMPPSLALPDS